MSGERDKLVKMHWFLFTNMQCVCLWQHPCEGRDGLFLQAKRTADATIAREGINIANALF
jgi:hypothetical protein